MKEIILAAIAFTIYLSDFHSEQNESQTRYYRHEVDASRTGMIMSRSQWEDYEGVCICLWLSNGVITTVIDYSGH